MWSLPGTMHIPIILYYNPVLVSPGTLAAEPCVVCTRLTYFQYSVHYTLLVIRQ